MARQSLVLLALAACSACAPRPTLPGGEAMHETTARVALHGGALTPHPATPRPAGASPRPLVVYGSGDGGWFGAAVGMFRMAAAGGYPTVGFSSRALLKTEQAGHTPLASRQI